VRHFVEIYDDLLEGRALLAQGLRFLRLVPDVGLFQFALNFRQTFGLAFVVKGTPLTRWRARSGRRFAA
jgi:hypothetical protein